MIRHRSPSFLATLVAPGVVLGALLLGSGCTSIDVIPRIGMLDIDGHIGIADTSSGVTATNDLKTLGLEDDSSVLGARVDGQVGGMHATFALSSSSHGGTGTAQATMTDDNGNTITANDPVESDFDVRMGEAIVTWDLVPGDMVEVGLGLGVSVFDLDASFTDQTTGDTIEAQQAVPIPVLALRAGVDFGRLDVSALLGGMSVDFDGNNVSFYDFDLMARWQLFGDGGKILGSVVGGYRYIDFDLEYEDPDSEVDASMTLDGPYLGMSFGF